jgi:hypothetical protein
MADTFQYFESNIATDGLPICMANILKRLAICQISAFSQHWPIFRVSEMSTKFFFNFFELRNFLPPFKFWVVSTGHWFQIDMQGNYIIKWSLLLYVTIGMNYIYTYVNKTCDWLIKVQHIRNAPWKGRIMHMAYRWEVIIIRALAAWRVPLTDHAENDKLPNVQKLIQLFL